MNHIDNLDELFASPQVLEVPAQVDLDSKKSGDSDTHTEEDDI